MTTIREILADPRYREFAAAVTECGKQVVPDAFPWNLMGRTDAEILGMPLRYEDGRPVPHEHAVELIAVVRAQERLVEGYWGWWLGWMWLSRDRPDELPTDRTAVMAEMNPCRPGAQRTLF